MRLISRRLLERLARKPIFILAPPRSGSTLLLESLSLVPSLFHTWWERDPVWWDIFPYDRNPASSDQVEGWEASPEKVEALRSELLLPALRKFAGKVLRGRVQPTPGDLLELRYLDKTVANCFHLEVLARAFPDAEYIALVRDPRANISSMIEGWRHADRFGKPGLQDRVRRNPLTTVQHWSYPAPPGWERQLHRPIEEICAWSWQQHVEAIVRFTEAGSARVLTIRYEDLVGDTRRTIAEIAERAALRFPEAGAAALDHAPLSRTTVSTPDPEKWRRNQERIDRILPMIETTVAKIGY